MTQKKKSSVSTSRKVVTKTLPPSLVSFKMRRLSAVATPYLKSFAKWFGIPAVLYLVIFFAMQPEYFFNFSKGFFLDNGDGFQNVWNIWWVNEALVNQGTNPYFTNLLHWPHGISLVPQTMNIFNALVAIPLMNLLDFSLVEAVNFAVVFAFMFGGVTMFWFIQKLYGTYWVSLIAGALFTFSSYHFAHAQGHLQLVSLEFIPLFLLAFWTLLEKMTYRYALLAAGSLFLLLLCDYYYLFWSVILAGLWFLWNLLVSKKIHLTMQTIKVMGVFTAVSAALIGPLLYALVSLTKHDPLMGSHDPYKFSLDPVSVIMPGGSWYWHELTDWYTNNLEYFAETSMFFGFGLLTVLIIAFIKRFIKKDTVMPRWLNFWWVILFTFGILALGPHLRTLGHVLEQVPLPYALLEILFPTLQISGMPVRWILIALIAAIIIGSYVLSKVDITRRNGKIIVAVFVLVSLIDLWPRPLPLTKPDYQAYVHFLKDQPRGAVIDNGALSGTEQLYNQTLHGKPLAFGYVTRTPQSVEEKSFHIFAAIEQGRIDTLCKEYKIRYFTTPFTRPIDTVTGKVIYSDKNSLIYDLKNSPEC
jgi:hypothetical protein